MTKKQVMTSIDDEVHEKAKERFINISELLERALRKKISDEIIQEKSYPFEFCEEHIPDHIKKTLFACAGIKARICKDCGKVFFVNDTKGEFTLCKYCWK